MEQAATRRRGIIKTILLACLLLYLFFINGCGNRTDKQAAPASAPDQPSTSNSNQTAAVDRMVFIKGGSFLMGADDEMPYEAPVHEITIKSFWIDAREVTVAEFSKFVEVTGYKTDSEHFGWSGVFNLKSGEWEKTDGANWRHPDGPGSKAVDDEPVTQVSWNDAVAYAKWAGKRLATEAEWEYAARGGLAGKRFVWGDELRPEGKPVANWWQGAFPDNNTGEDGYISRSPVGRFPANGYGLYDMAGNVWEWCSDWFDPNYYSTSAEANPKGPGEGDERVIRGGSWMCAENFCSNYRPAARSHATPDSALNNLGFRCVKDQ